MTVGVVITSDDRNAISNPSYSILLLRIKELGNKV